MLSDVVRCWTTADWSNEVLGISGAQECQWWPTLDNEQWLLLHYILFFFWRLMCHAGWLVWLYSDPVCHVALSPVLSVPCIAGCFVGPTTHTHTHTHYKARRYCCRITHSHTLSMYSLYGIYYYCVLCVIVCRRQFVCVRSSSTHYSTIHNCQLCG